MKQVAAKVIDNRWLEPEFKRSHARTILSTWIIRLRCPDIAREARPGQFVMVHCGAECLLPRPFSIHRVDSDDIAIFFAVWEDGKGTNWLSQRNKGDTVELLGPLGNGFSVSPTSKNLLLIAGGMGIAPLAFLAQEALRTEHSATLLYGTANASRYPESLLPYAMELVSSTEDGSLGKEGRVTDLLPDFIDWADQIFACGPMPMYHDMYARRGELLGGKPVQVSLEARMGCGLGICYGCTVKTAKGLKQVCRDGPVFDLDDIVWDELGILVL